MSSTVIRWRLASIAVTAPSRSPVGFSNRSARNALSRWACGSAIAGSSSRPSRSTTSSPAVERERCGDRIDRCRGTIRTSAVARRRGGRSGSSNRSDAAGSGSGRGRRSIGLAEPREHLFDHEVQLLDHLLVSSPGSRRRSRRASGRAGHARSRGRRRRRRSNRPAGSWSRVESSTVGQKSKGTLSPDSVR